MKSFVFWIGVGKKNWRWRFRDVGSDGQVPSSDRRLLQNWVLGRHSKEANENKVEKEEIEYDINNIMFKWPQRPRYLKLSFSDSKFIEVILRRQTQFLSTETAWITLGGQKTKKKLKCPNSQVTQSVSLSSQPPAACGCAKTSGVWRLCWKCITTIITTTIIAITTVIILSSSAAGASPPRSSEVWGHHCWKCTRLKLISSQGSAYSQISNRATTAGSLGLRGIIDPPHGGEDGGGRLI